STSPVVMGWGMRCPGHRFSLGKEATAECRGSPTGKCSWFPMVALKSSSALAPQTQTPQTKTRGTSMPKANELKRGDVVELNGQLLLIKEIEVNNPSARGAATLYKMRFTNVKTKLKAEERFKGDEILNTVELTRHPVTFSYIDGDDYIFMDTEDFSQYSFKQDDLEDELLFITEAIQGLQVLKVNDDVIGLELPQSIELEIIEAAPAMKGASASARTKPAKFVTGLVIQVPEYLETGERVRIHTQERRFMGRAD